MWRIQVGLICCRKGLYGGLALLEMGVDQCAQLLDALVVVVKVFYLCEIFLGMFHVSHAIITKGKHILAMDDVLHVERIFPDEQVG